MGRKSHIFQKKQQVGVRELAPLPSRSPLFATNCDGTACAACCEEYSDAAFASRIARAADARLTRDRWVPTLSREYRWGGNRKFFSKFIRPNNGSWKFATKVKNLLGKNEGGKFGLLRDLPSKFLCKKKLYGRFLDSRLRVQNLLKNLLSFLPTGLLGNISPQLRWPDQPAVLSVHDKAEHAGTQS